MTKLKAALTQTQHHKSHLIKQATTRTKDKPSMHMLSSRLSTPIAARAVRPELLLKCVAARYAGALLAKGMTRAAKGTLSTQHRFYSSTRLTAWGSKEFFHNDSRLRSSDSSDFLHLDHHNPQEQTIHYEIPMNVRQKVVSSKDAVSLV